MNRVRLRETVRYKTDEMLSRGTISLILFLGTTTLLILVLAGVGVILTEKEWAGNSIFYAVWKSFTLTLDAGNLAGVEGSVALIAIAAFVTLSGIFITSTLISIINTGLTSRLDDLHRGRARIMERNHTVILGYNDAIFTILTNLLIANENCRNACIVLLGQQDKQLMEEQISNRISKSRASRIICRSGDIACMNDLAHCSLETCKSIIVNETDDLQVIRTLLAISNYLGSEENRTNHSTNKHIHVTASINGLDNIGVARIAGGTFAEILFFNQIISRIMAHVCYQPGLSSVYLELFDFAGDEIYVECFPQLGGSTFYKAQLAFPRSTVIGIKRNDKFNLNPDPMTVLDRDDCLILIGGDDGVSRPTEMPVIIQNDLIHAGSDRYHLAATERLLILGSNDLLPEILSELNVFLPVGSAVTLACERNDICAAIQKTANQYVNLVLETQHTVISSRTALEILLEQGFKHILVLSDPHLPVMEADAKTLAVLLHIRDLARVHQYELGITSEMLDVRNQELAEDTSVTDFVISKNIVSLIMTQVSENRHLAGIFADLLDSEGSEIYLKPASHYVHLDQSINMYTVAHAVTLKNEVFVGYKRVYTKSNGESVVNIVTNPDKRSELSFCSNDWLIVLAED